MIESKADDLFISIDAYPMLKIGNDVVQLKEEIVTSEMLQELRKSLLTTEQEQLFKREKELDFAYSIKGVGRFRVNYFVQRSSDAIVIHHIPTVIKTLNELGLPSSFSKIALEDRGLILVGALLGLVNLQL